MGMKTKKNLKYSFALCRVEGEEAGVHLGVKMNSLHCDEESGSSFWNKSRIT